MLYELLTGRRPYEVRTTSPMGLHDAVCLTEPARPNVSGDLDNILLMAMRKEPARRYRSVEQFAQDIEHSLDHRPVLARPDTIRYRTAKFVRRNWWQIAAVATVILSLGAGLSSSLVEQRRANRRFNQVRELANRFLFDFHDAIVKHAGNGEGSRDGGLELASAAVPASAKSNRRRIVDIWTDQDRRFPGHPWIERRLAEARSHLAGR